MRISTKGRYGVRFLMDLAAHGDKAKVTLKNFARRQRISEKYLWQVVSPLKKEGLLRAFAGPGGGYSLARPAAAITLREIIAALEPEGAAVPCAHGPATPPGNECAAREIWKEVENSIGRVLDSFTLSDLAEKQRSLAAKKAWSYAI